MATEAVKFVPSQIKRGNRGTPKAGQTPYDFSSAESRPRCCLRELEGMRESIMARQQALSGMAKPNAENVLALCDSERWTWCIFPARCGGRPGRQDVAKPPGA